MWKDFQIIKPAQGSLKMIIYSPISFICLLFKSSKENLSLFLFNSKKKIK